MAEENDVGTDERTTSQRVFESQYLIRFWKDIFRACQIESHRPDR